MTTAASDPQIVPRRPGRADALESVLSDNTRRVYGAQWRLFVDWWDSVGLRSLPAEPLTVARYLAVRAGRRHHRHPAPGHLRHSQGPRVGRP